MTIKRDGKYMLVRILVGEDVKTVKEAFESAIEISDQTGAFVCVDDAPKHILYNIHRDVVKDHNGNTLGHIVAGRFVENYISKFAF